MKRLFDLFLSGADSAFEEDGLPDIDTEPAPAPDEGDKGSA